MDRGNPDRPGAGPSQRQLRVGELIRHALAGLLERGEARDPDLAGVTVTVTEVSVSPDLRNATAWVMPLGGSRAGEVVDSLRRAAPFFRRGVGRAVKLRRLPELSFELDPRFDAADRIAELLRTPAVAGDLDPSGEGTAPRDEP